MVNRPMENDSKVYWNMREAIRETGVPITTLRYWEQQFEQLNPHKDGHGNRYYTREDLDLIKQIAYLRDVKKITRIEAIREALKDPSKQLDIRQKTTEILTQIRKELVEIRKQI